MLRVALTGGIATGKSYCLERFAAHGVATIDADVLARGRGGAGHARPGRDRGALRRRRPRRRRRRSIAGARADRLRRRAGARRARSDRPSRGLPAHPRVVRQPAGGHAAWRSPTSRCCSRPATSTTSTRWSSPRAIPEEQVRRVMARDGLTDADARARLAAQWPIEEKVERADFVIWTDGASRRPTGRSTARTLMPRRGSLTARMQLEPSAFVSAVGPRSSSLAGAMRSSTNVFHSWQCGHCQSSSVLR